MMLDAACFASFRRDVCPPPAAVDMRRHRRCHDSFSGIPARFAVTECRWTELRCAGGEIAMRDPQYIKTFLSFRDDARGVTRSIVRERVDPSPLPGYRPAIREPFCFGQGRGIARWGCYTPHSSSSRARRSPACRIFDLPPSGCRRRWDRSAPSAIALTTRVRGSAAWPSGFLTLRPAGCGDWSLVRYDTDSAGPINSDRALTDNEELDAAALKRVRASRFHPARARDPLSSWRSAETRSPQGRGGASTPANASSCDGRMCNAATTIPPPIANARRGVAICLDTLRGVRWAM